MKRVHCSVAVFFLHASLVLSSRKNADFNSDWLFFKGELPWTCATAASVADFPVDLNGTFVNSLSRNPAGDMSPEKCAETCGCAGCQAWQFCNSSLCTASSEPGLTPRAAAACPPNVSWPHLYDGEQCDGLQPAAASNVVECQDACCEDPTCDIYQWCNASTCSPMNSCWIGVLNPPCSAVAGWRSRARDLPVAAACYTGLLADYGPGNIVTEGPGWVGAGRLQPPAPPSQGSGPGAFVFDDSAWQSLSLPHDYLSSGTPNNTGVAPHQAEHGYVAFSDAWYRKHFTVPAGTGLVRVYFDGVWRSASVFLNGALAAQHEEGYTGFSVWLHNVTGGTLNIGGGDNVLALHIDGTTYTFELWSYEGAGIQRAVTLTMLPSESVASITPWGVFAPTRVTGPVSAPDGAAGLMTADAVVEPRVDIAASPTGAAATALNVSCTVFAPDGVTTLGSSSVTVSLQPGGWVRVLLPPIALSSASLWFPAPTPNSPDRPLYTLMTSVWSSSGGSLSLQDSQNVTFGVRSVVFNATSGLWVNGFPLKIRGLAIHQDFGPTGTFQPPNVHAFRVQRLLDMGGNGWRTAHNPVDSVLLDELDRRGVLVWSEARYLRMWASYVQDAQDMVLRDRNHPAVILWSLCNENGCGEGAGDEGAPPGVVAGGGLARTFMAAIAAADGTRPVTANSHDTSGANGTILAVLDVMGLTYDYSGLDVLHAWRPSAPVMNGESASCQSSRCDYPVNTGALDCTQEAWEAAYSRPWSAGSFVWAGFNYGGESSWPGVYSYYGVHDVCGFGKPILDWYRAWWGTQAGHVGAEARVAGYPAWSLPGKEGSSVTIVGLASAAFLQLRVNGLDVGGRTPVPALGYVTWTSDYAPGNYTIDSFDAAGALLGSFMSVTAGQPAALAVSLEWPGSGPAGALLAGGVDVALLRVSVLDAAGVLVPWAATNVTLTVTSGPGELLGVCSGDETDHLPRQGLSYRPAYGGLLMATVRSAVSATGNSLVITASAAGITFAEISIPVVNGPSGTTVAPVE